MHILLATDAQWIVDEVVAALGGPDTSFTVCREGRLVAKTVGERQPDLAIFDLQIGTMGGMAVTMSLRLDESAGVLPRVPILMLVDRRADLHLARRSGADGWLVKPLDPIRLSRSVAAVAAGGTWEELVPKAAPMVNIPSSDDEAAEAGDVDVTSSAEEEPATAG